LPLYDRLSPQDLLLVPQGYDPELAVHSDSCQKQFDYDVVFIGHSEKHYVSALRSVAEVTDSIGPFEVESALIQHPAVIECAVTGVPDPNRGQVVKATVVLAKGYAPSDELKATLQQHVKDVTAPYKYPRLVEFVEQLPKTISGKIRRTEIRARDSRPGGPSRGRDDAGR